MSREAQFHKEKTTMMTQRSIHRITGAPKIGAGDKGHQPHRHSSATWNTLKEMGAVVFLAC